MRATYAVVVGVVALSLVAAPVAGAVGLGPQSTGGTAVLDPSPDGAPGATAGTAPADDAERAAEGPGGAEKDVDPPEDPESDVKGWENGYWYNESLPDVDPSDGYSESELDKVVARAMARNEVIRDIEYEVTPPVKVVSRERYVENVRSRYENANVSVASRLHQNTKYEALFVIGENTDYFDAQQRLQSGAVLGFYVSGNASDVEFYSEGDIVLISEDAENPKVSEITLSQELFHSYQDKQLRTTTDYDVTTEEDARRIGAIIEGDGNLVDFLYQQRCDSDWQCFQPSTGPGGGGPRPNPGLLVYALPQYTEGPAWVQGIYQRGGWEAVNELYENPPESTEQFIHPEKYLNDSPTNVTVEDRSNEEWDVLELEGGVNYAEFGEAGIYTMFWFSSPAVPNDDLFTGRELDAYDYDHPASAGWDGDKLYPYVNDSSNETGETGYVWKTVWDSDEDAEEFADAYVAILDAFGDPVDARQDTWRIPDQNGFGDAFYVNVTGSTVTIVNAPTVGALPEVRAGAAPEAEVTTTTATPTTTATTTADTTTDDGETTTRTTTADTTAPETPTGDGTTATSTGTSEVVDGQGQPGFGPAVAVIALLIAALVAARRRRS